MAARAGDGFVSDRGHAAIHQIDRLFGIGREVEIGVEDLVLAQHRAFDRLGLLDLHHHLAFGEDLVRRVDDFCAGFDILRIGHIDPGTGVGFDPDFMALQHQLVRAFGRQADAVFVVLDFLGAADTHFGEFLSQSLSRD